MCRGVSHTPSTAANISTEKSGAKRCFVANTFAAIVFIFAHIRAYAIRPYGFPVTQKQLYSHIMICAIVLPSKMSSQMGNHHLPGVNDTFAMGYHGLKSEQNTSSTCEMRTVFLRKTAIATAMEVDHLAQTASAFAEMKLSLRQSGVGNCRSDIVPCANRHRICRNEIVPPTLRLRQSR